jgi:hypothetical protein
MMDCETKHRFIELRAQGASFDRCSKELGKSKQTLINLNKELEDEIANVKAIELEALYESYFLTKRNQVIHIGTILNNLKCEIESRNLSDIPTDKLFDLFFKYHSFIKAECIEPRFKTESEMIEAQKEKESMDRLIKVAFIEPEERRLGLA